MPPRKSGGRGRPPARNPVPTTYTEKEGGMGEAQWTAARDMLEAVYTAKDGGRKMSEIFQELPDKEEYADYYEAIPEPECLDNIATRLTANGYASPEAFFKQLHLVFLNAKHYNEEHSQVWNDAETYAKQIHEAWRANASAGIFAFADPYHKTPRGRKPKAETKVERSSSSAPSPAAKAESTPTPVTIHLRVPRPEAAAPAAPAPAPTPPAPAKPATPAAPPPPPTRTRETRGSRTSLDLSAAKAAAAAQPQAAPPMPSPPLMTWSALSQADAAVVNMLDAKLERWGGPQNPLPGDPAPGGVPGSGWWGEGAPEFERSVGGSTSYKNRIRTAAEAIAGYKDPQGRILSSVLGLMPLSVDIPYVSKSSSPGFNAILQAARAGQYGTLYHFDLDMTRMFEKARRWFQSRPDEYGRVLTLQRLYNAITAPYPMSLGPNGLPGPSKTLFASLPVGPGRARTLQDVHDARRAGATEEQAGYGITTTRISQKDRMFTEEARHKGVPYRVGDYVHLINPDDASRPIVGQIFKTFIPTKGYSTHHVTVCWYFRPEQTIHPAEQMFVEHEVFKTAHFCDHPVEDIIERISVQPTDSAARGRPKVPGAFYPGWPLYVCSTRYIDKACIFMRIKKWSNIIPEGRRHIDVTTVIPYQRPIALPTTKSPFTQGVTGPGSIGRPRRQPMPGDAEEDEREAAYAQSSSARPQQQQPATPVQRQPAPGTPGPPGSSSRTPVRPPVQQRTSSGPVPRVAQNFSSRTFASIVGGSQVLEQAAVREYLPPDTAKLFEQDSRHQVLWFSGPPLAPGAVYIPSPPSHSLEYLSYLAKRKRGVSKSEARAGKRFCEVVDREEGEEDAVGEVEGEDEEDDLSKAWWAQGLSKEQVLDSLKAVVA